MGLFSLSTEQKEQLATRMHNLFFSEFLFLKLDKLLNEEDLFLAGQMLKEKKDIKEIVDFIAKRVPDFYEHYQAYVGKQKKILIEKHFVAMISDLENALFAAKTLEEKISLEKKKHQFEKAKEYFKQQKYPEVQSTLL